MKFSPRVEEQIINALASRLPGRTLGACSICKTAQWQLVNGFVALILTDEPQQIKLGGQILPSAILYCTKCGNTHLLNLQVLGLDHLLTPESEAGVRLPEVPQEPPSGIVPPPRKTTTGAQGSGGLVPPPRYRKE